MDIVIIGSGAAGLAALDEIRKLDRNSGITVVSKDPYPYMIPSLPYFVSGDIAEKDLQRYGDDYFSGMNAKTMFGTDALRVLPDRKKVALSNGAEIGYDRLLLATGSSPIKPNIPGIDKEGVCCLGSLDDANSLKKRAVNGKKAVVVGAGFVGLEGAIALRKLGLDVTVVELMDRIIPRMLDPDMAKIATKILTDRGIKFMFNAQVVEITGGGHVDGVRLKDSTIECDIVLLGLGVRPNTALAKSAGIECNRGILVDDFMKTNVDGMYAAGDIVEAPDFITRERKIIAIWSNAEEQGRVAASNMLGIERKYPGSDSVNISNLFDVPLSTVGYTASDATPPVEILKTEKDGFVRKVVLKDGIIIGVQTIGESRSTSLFLSLIRKRVDVTAYRDRLLEKKPTFEMPGKT